MVEPNRRHSPRQYAAATIQLLIVPAFSKGCDNRCDLISAKICNQSEEGVCLEIERELQPGSNVTIKIDEPAGGLNSKDAYHVRDGRIIWCKKVDAETPRYGVGVKILRKTVWADILTSRFKSPGTDNTAF
jgi:hypothetical protein